MADSKINGLTSATALADTDLYVIYQGGVTKQLTGFQIKEFIDDGGASIGTVTHSINVQTKFDHTESAGITDGGVLTDNLNGTINLTAGEAYIRAVDDPHTTLYVAEFGLTTNLALVDNEANIVYLDYNAGALTFATTTDPTTIDITTKLPAYYIFRKGTDLHIRDIRFQNVDNTAKHQKHMFFTETLKRASGGVLSDKATLHVGVTPSSFYFQLLQMTTPEIDTTLTDTFTRFYRDGASGYTSQINQSIVDNINYDDGDGTLGAIGISKFGVEWFYLIIDSTHTELVSMYGRGSYGSLAEAEASLAPADAPNVISSFGTLIGKAVFQQGNTELTEIQSAYEVAFGGALIENHNNLGGLNVGDYQHLTTDEKALIPFTNQANTFTKPTRGAIVAEDNAIDLTVSQFMTITATGADITFSAQTVGQAGKIRISSSENITGWSTNANWGTGNSAPTGLTGITEFTYFVDEASGIGSITVRQI